jgi:hypothetical protein
MNKNAANSKQAIIILSAAVVLVTVAVAIAAITSNNDAQINSFQECVDAGYATTQSFPETCSVPEGKSFTNS